MPTRIARLLLRVADIERATAFYDGALGLQGRRVSPGRHHYDAGGVELALYDPRADGDAHDTEVVPGTTQVYLAVEDLEGTFARAKAAGARIEQPIETKPWGERTFYAADPFGHRLCFLSAEGARGRRE